MHKGWFFHRIMKNDATSLSTAVVAKSWSDLEDKEDKWKLVHQKGNKQSSLPKILPPITNKKPARYR